MRGEGCGWSIEGQDLTYEESSLSSTEQDSEERERFSAFKEHFRRERGRHWFEDGDCGEC